VRKFEAETSFLFSEAVVLSDALLAGRAGATFLVTDFAGVLAATLLAGAVFFAEVGVFSAGSVLATGFLKTRAVDFGTVERTGFELFDVLAATVVVD